MKAAPSVLPDSDERCPWWDPDAFRPLGSRLEENVNADCVVVGGGYTGLACARRLAELRPQWRVAVLEALRVGQGSAGRNSGFVVDTGHWNRSLDVEGNARRLRLARHGISRLREAEVECGWADCGRYHVAVNRRGRAELGRFRAGLDAMKEPYEVVDPDALARGLGTSYYAEALHLPGGALVQPAELVRGLAASVPESVDLFESTPVVRIEPGVVHTEHGRVTSPRFVCATNGFARAFGIARGRIVPLLTFASVTEPLAKPPGTLEQWGAVPEEQLGSTLRLTADRRILVRNGVRYWPAARLHGVDHSAMAAMHRRTFELRFPELTDVPFSHTWTGVLGVALGGGTAFGRVGDNAWVSCGFNGVGIALGTALGDVLAHEVTGTPHPLRELAAQLPAPGWLPPGPLQAVGLPAYTGVLQLLAGSER